MVIMSWMVGGVVVGVVVGGAGGLAVGVVVVGMGMGVVVEVEYGKQSSRLGKGGRGGVWCLRIEALGGVFGGSGSVFELIYLPTVVFWGEGIWGF